MWYINRKVPRRPPDITISHRQFHPFRVGEIEDSFSRFATPPQKSSFRTAGYESTVHVPLLYLRTKDESQLPFLSTSSLIVDTLNVAHPLQYSASYTHR
jgi:hypothetical protein